MLSHRLLIASILYLILWDAVNGFWDSRRRRRRNPCPGGPIHCQVSAWSDWSSCSVPCGTSGTQTRTRTITVSPRCGGSACPTLTDSPQSCNNPGCHGHGTPLSSSCDCDDEWWDTCCNKSCTAIANCQQLHCTSATNHACHRCNYDRGGDIKAYELIDSGSYPNRVCQQICSWRPDSKFCYPGNCPSTPSSCSCAPGFSGDNCMHMTTTPNMNYCIAKLIRIVGDTTVEADCDDRVTASQTVYTNLVPDRILVKWHNNYVGPNAASYPKPRYIHDFKVGVVSASFDWRVQRGSSDVKTGSAACSLGYDQDNPHQAMHDCEVHDDFSFTFQHADRFYVTVKSSNGGYVNIRNYDGTSWYTVNPKQYYQGQTISHTADFTLDYQPPEHCSVTGSCAHEMIDRGPTITKNGEIMVHWSGWSDNSSGVFKYEYEVYKMRPYGDVLGYRSIEPIMKDGVDASSSWFTMNLTEPADYCVLLTVDDVAGNHIRARRFLIFDDVNVVDIDPTGHYPLWVDSASANTSYLWQTNLQDESFTGSQVVTRWPGHFYNQFHRQHKMLNEIEDHSPPLTSDYEEGTGQPPETRSQEAIPNINAIVRFEVDYALDHQGGRSIMKPPGTWRGVDDIMVEKQTFDISRIDGDSIRMWVRASDVMGNENMDEILVHIDSTPPQLQDIFLKRLLLEKSSDYDTIIIFHVKISFLAYDDHSGLHTIQWKLIDLSDNIVHREGNIAVTRPKISDCSPPNCECIPKDNECYGKNYVLQIDSSDVVMPIDKNSDYSVIVSVTNNAMLQTAEQLKIPYCQDTVRNLNSSEVTTTNVVITWDEPICPESFVEYQVAINSTSPEGVSSEMTPDTNYTFSRLVEDTEYTVMVKPRFDLKRFGTESRMTVKTLSVTGPYRNRGEKQGTNAVAISVPSTLVIIFSIAMVSVAVLLWRRHANKTPEDDTVRFHKRKQKGKSPNEDLSLSNAAYEDITEPTATIEQPYSEIAPIGSDETRADNNYETVKTPVRREQKHIVKTETESEYCQLNYSTLDNSVYTGLSFNKRGKNGRPL